MLYGIEMKGKLYTFTPKLNAVKYSYSSDDSLI